MKFLKLLISVKTIIAFIGITLSTQAFSQETGEKKFEPVETIKDWRVFVAGNPKECWAMSEPKEKINTRDGQIVNVKRGDVQLFINFLPSARAHGQLSFTGGYPFAEGSKVSLKVMRNSGDGINYALFTQDEWAWAPKDEDDKKIINAMKKGAKAVLTAKSSRGTKTQDTFSLMGFTAAIADAEKRCE